VQKISVRFIWLKSFLDTLKVHSSGAPVTQEFADEIGADGFGLDASQAATLAKQIFS